MNAREGVQVRVVTDKDQYFLTHSKAYVLDDDHIPVELPLGVMHDKFVIIDDTILLSGTSGKFFTNVALLLLTCLCISCCRQSVRVVITNHDNVTVHRGGQILHDFRAIFDSLMD